MACQFIVPHSLLEHFDREVYPYFALEPLYCAVLVFYGFEFNQHLPVINALCWLIIVSGRKWR
ncbi:hypothetical protein HLRTI_003454 [Halorhabdus tiamatea SARL4B]|uniref:Uncharacterized protein n=1 Tax=Halorhabdus tiamatea SARL4B TaxID=1033806 RepID=U2DXN9_9EURY|nr:hypothetical protein HLRTI_003454 [Halorhabdus tiamatea SARL4B]